MQISPACLSFDSQGTPTADAYSDVYHAAAGGPAQARHVFLAGNGLPARWRGRERFTLLETGFGLGLNFLATWQAWRDDPAACATLEFVSVEKHPVVVSDLARAHAAWPEFSGLAAALRAQWPPLVTGEHRLVLDDGRVVLRLIFGDALEVLRDFELCADAFYLDGFSPARNPEMWSPALCAALARLAAPGATLATWSVAGPLRRALAAAGVALSRRPGFADKREMLTGQFRCSETA